MFIEDDLNLYDYLDSIEFVDEVYFGVNKDIEELIELLSIYRSKYMGRMGLHMYVPGSDSSKELLAFSNKLKDVFGIIYDVSIYPSKYANAYTYPIIYNLGIENPEKHIYSTKDGWKVDPKLKYCSSINVSANVMFNPDFSDREVMAVILHEVGHSFVQIQQEICPTVQAVRDSILIATIVNVILHLLMGSTFNALIDVVNYIKSFNGVKKFIALVDKGLRNNPIGRAIGTFTDITLVNLGIVVSDFANGLLNILGVGSLAGAITVLANPGIANGSKKQKEKIRHDMRDTNAYGRSMEYLSDNFAADYGLGAEQTTALMKLTYAKNEDFYDKVAKGNPINFLLGELCKAPYYEIIMTTDAHPTVGERARYIQDDLKRELAKGNMNPEARKELEASIKIIDEQIKQIRKFAELKKDDPDGYAEVINAVFLDDHKLSDSEKEFTSAKDREDFYKSKLREFATIDPDWDPFEFDH